MQDVLRRGLEGALVLLARPSRWTTRVEAVDRHRRGVPAGHPAARAWDLLGALHRVLGELEAGEYFTLVVDHLAERLPPLEDDQVFVWGGYWRLSLYQDQVGHEVVIAFLENALRETYGHTRKEDMMKKEEELRAERAQAVQLLERELVRISDPARWCQGKVAIDQHGRGVSFRSPEAVAWDVLGALFLEDGAEHLVFGTLSPAAKRAYFAMWNDRGGGHKPAPGTFNDLPTTKHADLVTYVEQGILRLERGEF